MTCVCTREPGRLPAADHHGPPSPRPEANVLAGDDRVYWVATLPPRVNINRLEMMPVFQSFAGLSIYRQPPK